MVKTKYRVPFVRETQYNREVIFGREETHLKVVRGRTLTDTPGHIVVATVARAEPPAVVTRVRQRHAPQMGAHTDGDQPLSYAPVP